MADLSRGRQHFIGEIHAPDGISDFAYSFWGVGDRDGDGHDDLRLDGHIEEGKNGDASYYIGFFSGRTMEEIERIVLTPGDRRRLSHVGDRKGDGASDDLWVEPDWSNSDGERVGRVLLVSRPDGETLWSLEGEPGRVPNYARESGDIDGDGLYEIEVGREHSGAIEYYSYPNEVPLLSMSASEGYFISYLGDVDGDGCDDFHESNRMGDDHGIDSGTTRVISVWDPSEGRALEEPRTLHVITGDRFGDRSADARAAGDLDGDGHDEFLVGAYQASGSAYQSGRLRVYSGKTGRIMYEHFGGFCALQAREILRSRGHQMGTLFRTMWPPVGGVRARVLATPGWSGPIRGRDGSVPAEFVG